jgi:uncharacterized protein
MNDDLAALKNFGGIARLFPLPNVVLFPLVLQPLHIFEPRYRQMTADALADDRLIAVALLRPGWEADYEGRPPIHSIACLGRIMAEQKLPDGRYNLLLRGLSRIRIEEEIQTEKRYRSARVRLLASSDPPATAVTKELRQSIVERAPAWFPIEGPARDQLLQLLHSKLALGMLCDLLSFALPLPTETKQELLEELNTEQRARALLTLLEKKQGAADKDEGDRRFPPDFSSN